MTAHLELGASQALFAARTMVDALHVSEGWEMQWGEIRVPASREFSSEGVEFQATFPDACWLAPPDASVLLLLDGQVRGMRRIDHPGDTAFQVTWELAMTMVSA